MSQVRISIASCTGEGAARGLTAPFGNRRSSCRQLYPVLLSLQRSQTKPDLVVQSDFWFPNSFHKTADNSHLIYCTANREAHGMEEANENHPVLKLSSLTFCSPMYP